MLAVLVGGLVVLAIAVGVFVAARPNPRLDESTPEGTVQAYLEAIRDRDVVAAARHLDPASGCDADDLDTVGYPQFTAVDLVTSQVDGDTARVSVQVTFSAAVPPLDGPVGETHTYRLTRSGDGWLLVGTPWPLDRCGGGTK